MNRDPLRIYFSSNSVSRAKDRVDETSNQCSTNKNPNKSSYKMCLALALARYIYSSGVGNQHNIGERISKMRLGRGGGNCPTLSTARLCWPVTSLYRAEWAPTVPARLVTDISRLKTSFYGWFLVVIFFLSRRMTGLELHFHISHNIWIMGLFLSKFEKKKKMGKEESRISFIQKMKKSAY